MAIKKYVDGAYEETTSLKRYVDGAWQSVTSAKVYEDGAWAEKMRIYTPFTLSSSNLNSETDEVIGGGESVGMRITMSDSSVTKTVDFVIDDDTVVAPGISFHIKAQLPSLILSNLSFTIKAILTTTTGTTKTLSLLTNPISTSLDKDVTGLIAGTFSEIKIRFYLSASSGAATIEVSDLKINDKYYSTTDCI